MATTDKPIKIAIIGAGLGGSLMAIYLARLGFDVHVFERRGDMRSEDIERGRSINMTLAARGLVALKEVELFDTVMQMTIPLKGRILHTEDGAITFQPYGKNDQEVIHSVMRHDLNIVLMNAAMSYPNVRFNFYTRCTRLDKQNKVLQLMNQKTGETSEARFDLIVGADGVFSSVRQQMQRGERASYRQDFLNWGYKELTIPPGPDGSFQMSSQGLHIWPQGQRMLMAMPNSDGSFTCTCILPFEGEDSFEMLRTDEQIVGFFKKHFPEVVPLMPTLAEDFKQNAVVEMITTHTSPWHYKSSVVLVGDACHAVVPFYGQGMNAAFEDCSLLRQCIAEGGGDWEAAFKKYESLRKRHTDALAELSTLNFTELREKVRSPVFVARKQVDVLINKLFPNAWIPLYTRISHTTMPVADAVELDKRQNRIAKWCGIDLLLMLVATLLVISGFFRNLKPGQKPNENEEVVANRAKVTPLSKGAGGASD